MTYTGIPFACHTWILASQRFLRTCTSLGVNWAITKFHKIYDICSNAGFFRREIEHKWGFFAWKIIWLLLNRGVHMGININLPIQGINYTHVYVPFPMSIFLVTKRVLLVVFELQYLIRYSDEGAILFNSELNLRWILWKWNFDLNRLYRLLTVNEMPSYLR